jgi:hypothetical protein
LFTVYETTKTLWRMFFTIWQKYLIPLFIEHLIR